MVNRKIAPSFVKSTQFELLDAEVFQLSGNNKIHFISGGDQEVVKIELVFPAGRWFESSSGISHFAATLLPKGTQSKTSSEITSLLDYYGLHLEINPGFDFTSVTLYGLSKYIDRVLDVLLEIISSPTYPENELQQAKDIFRQGLKINLEKTNFLASRQFRKTLFGPLYPYGKDIELEDIDAVDQPQLLNFNKQHFKNFLAFVSGKPTEQLKSQLVDKLRQLHPNSIKQETLTRNQSLTTDSFEPKNNSVQTSIRTGKMMIARDHSDYPAVLLLNHILGGFFGSRLMKNIREEKGLTYGIHSSIHALKHDSYLAIGADVNKENREVTIDEIKKEIALLRMEPISENELETVRNHFIGSLQSDMSTPFAHADKHKVISLFNLQKDYYQQLIHSLSTLTKLNLLNTAQKHFSDENLVTVSVG
ncbi:MAG: insulinase family protein [Cyclobacteriaceae bacterium]|nr:insulinase family protein [Cyclobacteriaceae bacterium]